MGKNKLIKPNEVKDSKVWFKILNGSLNIPGALINRELFLEKSLSKYVSEEKVKKAIQTSPSKARIPKKTIQKLAKSSINLHTTKTTALSFGAGLPGGWWIAGTIPFDVVQFYFHVIQILQKLAYLHGWPQFTDDADNIDDETMLKFTIFIGVMFGVEAANQAVNQIAKRLAKETAKRLPKKALTKSGIYNVSKQVAKWISVKITKESFSKNIGKAIPILGGFISGTITFITFKPMAKKLNKHFTKLKLS